MTARHYLPNFAFVLVLSLLCFGCASVQQPQGGPRDTTPPKVVRMVPKDFSTNFKSEQVVIEFDEYFELQNEFKEVSISPEQEQPPVLKRKQRRLEVTFQQPLDSNTTYTINFGNAIADVNERNPLKNFTYVFSTGPALDSTYIAGNVKNAYTQLPELDALVFLLPVKADTTFGKKKPAIYTRTDSSGNFRLRNLRKDTYRIYALKDKNNDKLYQEGDDEIAFLKDSVVLTGNRDSVQLSFFKEIPRTLRNLERKIANDGTILMSFNRSLKAPTVKVIDPPALDEGKLFKFNATTDSVRIWLNKMDFDSVKVAIVENGTPMDTISFTRAKSDTYTRLLLPADNLNGGQLVASSALKITFPLPVLTIDKQKVTLMEDTIPRSNFTIVKDSTDMLSYFVNYRWKQKVKYELRFAEDAVTGIFNSKNKYFTKKLEAIPNTNNSFLEFTVTTARKGANHILELITENKGLVSRFYFKQDTILRIPTIRSGRYFVRVIYDVNNNGIWDTGKLIERIQPEEIWYDPKLYSVKPNWEVKETVVIP